MYVNLVVLKSNCQELSSKKKGFLMTWISFDIGQKQKAQSFWAKTQNLIFSESVTYMSKYIITEPILVTRLLFWAELRIFEEFLWPHVYSQISTFPVTKNRWTWNWGILQEFFHQPLTSLIIVIKSTYLLNVRFSMFSVFCLVCYVKKGLFWAPNR